MGDLTAIFNLAREMHVDLIQMGNFDPVIPEHHFMVLSAEDKEIFEKQKEYLDRKRVRYNSCLYFDDSERSGLEKQTSQGDRWHCNSGDQTREKNMCGVP